MEKPFEHAVIIGCGLLGASLGLALRHKGLARVVTGVGRQGSPSVAIAQQRGALDRATDDAARAVGGGALAGESSPPPPADLVVVCVPVRQFPEMFRRLAPALAPGALVTDVGSTKAQVMQWAAELLPAHTAFVGSHPMTGGEKSGPQAARENLFQNAVCLVCRPTNVSAAAYQRVIGLWKALGMRIIACYADQHDRWVAAVSHLPYAVAATLVHATAGDPAALETAAGGFTDTSRIASGDVTMWTDILLTNRPAVSAMIGRYQENLQTLKSAVDRGDEAAIRAFLTQAKNSRDAFIAQRRLGGDGGA
jgi:prephenate dehydrogenase